MHRHVFLFGLCLLLVFHVLPVTQSLSAIDPVKAQEAQSLFIGGTLNPLFFHLPITAREDASQREEKSAVFDLGNGKFAAVSDGRQMFTPDENNQLVPVEKTGKKRESIFVFDRLPEHVHITFDLTHPSYTLTQDNHSFTLAFATAGIGTIENDQTVAYALGDGVTLRWQVVGNHVHKAITIEKPGTLPDLSFTMTTSDNLVQLLEDNHIRFTDAVSKKMIFTMDAPFLTDLHKEKLSTPVTLHEKEKGTYEYLYNKKGLPYPYILDPSSGPNSPGTVVDDATLGTISWTNPTNATTSNDVYAVANLNDATISHYLKATNFGFNIPLTLTMYGIIAEIEHKCNLSTGTKNCIDSTVKLVKGGTVSGNNNGDTLTIWPTSDAYASYGNSSDLWGVTLTPADINASTFGLVLSVLGTANVGAPNASIDHIRMTVYFGDSTVPDLPWWSACIFGTLFLPLALQKRTKETYT